MKSNFSSSEDPQNFERERIRALQEERLHIQKKTFTKWVNSFLQKARLEIEDLFTDLSDGRNLLKLLEIISGEKLGKPNHGKMRVHKIENVNRCLAFLHTKVRLESIGAEDIVDGNPRLILGLIWTIILRFQIQEIEINVDDQEENGEKKSAKDALLLWCQRRTQDYHNVNIRDFTSSWRDGLGFNALIHSQRPELVDYNRLDPADHIGNLELCGHRGGKRIGNIVSKIRDVENQQEQFETLSSSLLAWILIKTQEMKNRTFENSLKGIRGDLKKFKSYLTVEKPPKCKEKVDIEATYFEIQTKLKQLNQNPYASLRLAEQELAWNNLEREEHLKEFERKSKLRDGYLEEMIQVLIDPRYGSNLQQVEASLKKHEAISADIMSREDRFHNLKDMSQELNRENYCHKDRVSERAQFIMDKWKTLTDLLEKHRIKLVRYNAIVAYIQLEQSDVYVPEVIQKLHLLESELNVLSDSVKKIRSTSKQYLGDDNELSKTLAKSLDPLILDYDALLEESKNKRKELEDYQVLYQMNNDLEEVRQWLNDKIALNSSPVIAKDLRALQLLQEKNKMFQNELSRWFIKYESSVAVTEDLSSNKFKNFDADKKIHALNLRWEELRSLVAMRDAKLANLFEILTFLSDCNDIDSWLKEMMSLEIAQQVEGFETDTKKIVSTGRKVIETAPKRVDKKPEKIVVYEERLVPQVKTLYPYEGHGVSVIKGEILFLINKSNHDWWNIRKENGHDGFVPRNYVSEVDPKKVQVEVVKTTEKSNIDNEISQEALNERVLFIEREYTQVVDQTNQRKDNLVKAIKQFNFSTKCDDALVWIKEKQKAIQTKETPDGMRDILHSIARFQDRISAIVHLYEELTKTLPSEKTFFKRKLNEVLSHVDEALEWVTEKSDTLSTLEKTDITDPKQLDILQRRHRAFERELIPIQDKVQYIVNNSADQVKKEFPQESKNISKKVNYLSISFADLSQRATKRGELLNNRVSADKYRTEVKAYMKWANDAIQVLETDEKISDSKMAADLMRSHKELKDDIDSKEDGFKELLILGNELNEPVKDLENKHSEVCKLWDDKKIRLKRAKELQQLHKEGDIIDSYITSQLRQQIGLKPIDGEEELESAIKRESEFVNSIDVHNNRLAAFQDMADELNDPDIVKKNQKLQDKWKDLASSRAVAKKDLENTKEYLEFNLAVENMNKFIADKSKVARDRSFRDTSNLKVKIKHHEVFEGELKANVSQVKLLNMMGHKLRDQNHPRSIDIDHSLKKLNSNWDALLDETKNKNKFLKQAIASGDYGKMVVDILNRQNAIAKELEESSKEEVEDRRHCRQLMTKHQNLENDFKVILQKIVMLEEHAKHLADGHFESEKILAAVDDCNSKMDSLRPAIAQRKKKLQDALKYQEFKFEFNSELQWINEKKTLASSKASGNSLQQVRALCKRHKNLEEEVLSHLPAVEKLYDTGKTFGDDCKEVKSKWSELESIIKDKSSGLDIAQRYQSYFFEVNEIENWIELKNSIIKSEDTGKDEDSTVKLLTKQKAIELEIDSYTGIINELKNEASMLGSINDPQARLVKNKDDLLSQEIKALHRRSKARRNDLMNRLKYHEYMRESKELEQWIKEKNGNCYFSRFRNVLTGNEKFKSLTALAKRLGDNDDNVQDIQDQLTEDWETLLAAIEVRDKKLEAAGEIHRYNRDAAEALNRIQEKFSALGDDYGKDVKSVQGMIRSHEVFENDLVALEAQLQVLIDDASNLRAKYPGPNAEHIDGQQATVIKNWEALQEKAKDRKFMLQVNYDYHSFLRMSKDLLTWASHLETLHLTEERVHDVGAAQVFKTEHENLKAEIESREASFHEIVQAGEAMIGQNHPNSEEIGKTLSQVLNERQNLHMGWQQKKVYLDQLCDLQFFLRDARNILAFLTAHEHSLTKDVSNLSTLVETENEIKQHETFKNLLNSYDEKTKNLKSHCNKLTGQNHFDSKTIKSKMEEVEGFIEKIHSLSKDKIDNLALQKMYQVFNRDISEMEDWIEEKRNKFTDDSKNYESATLHQKIKFLKRYQVFENEITQNKKLLERVMDNGESLIKKKHAHSTIIQENLSKIDREWRSLNQLSEEIRKDLEDALDMHNFNMQAEKIEAWIRDKELMINASELGKDFEHCKELERKLNDADSDMKVDDDKMKKMKSLAKRISSSNLVNSQEISNRFDNLIQKWDSVQSSLMKYRTKLNFALGVHKFHRDLDDVDEMISEKRKQLDTEENIKTLEDAKRNAKKSNTILDFFKSLDPRIKDLASKGNTFKSEACEKHLVRVDKLISFHEFMNTIKDQKSGIEDINKQMELEHIPLTQNEIDDAFRLHEEKKSVLLSPKEAILNLKNKSQEIESVLPEEKEILHSQISSLQTYFDEANHEALLDSKDLGDSIGDVEILTRKHDSFEKSLSQQIKEGYTKLKSEGQGLIENNHFAKEKIQDNLEDLKERLDKKIFEMKSWSKEKLQIALDETYLDLTNILSKIQRHSAFESEILANEGRLDTLKSEAEGLTHLNIPVSKEVSQQIKDLSSEWLHLIDTIKMKKIRLEQANTANTYINVLKELKQFEFETSELLQAEDYGKDLNSVKALLKKQTEIETDLGRYHSQLSDMKEKCETHFENNHHFMLPELKKQTEVVVAKFENLHDPLQRRRDNLEDSLIFHELQRDVQDELLWFEEKIELSASRDYGNSLVSVESMMKKHQLIETDILNHENIIRSLIDKGEQMIRSQHWSSKHIQKIIEDLKSKMASLKDHSSIRKLRLEDALDSQHFYIQCAEISGLIAEKELFLFAALESELEAHASQVNVLSEKAETLIKRKHFDSVVIAKKIKEIEEGFKALQDSVRVRKDEFLSKQKVMAFIRESEEIVDCINRLLPIASSVEYGKDLFHVEVLIQKFDSNFLKLLDSYKTKVKELDQSADALKKEGINDKEITWRINDVHSQWEDLNELALARQEALFGAKKVHAFDKTVDETLEWINEKEAILSVDDTCQDIETAHALLQRQEGLHRDLVAIKDQVKDIGNDAEKLCVSYPDAAAHINVKRDELDEGMLGLERKAKDRDEQLKQNEKLLEYYSDYRELMSWTTEIMSKVTGPELGKNLQDAEFLTIQHNQYLSEIQSRNEEFDNFEKTGLALIDNHHFMSDDIQERISVLCSRKKTLDQCWSLRSRIYSQHLDYFKWLKQIHDLESWLGAREVEVSDGSYGNSIQDVEFLLAKQNEIEKSLASKDERISDIERLTLIETEFAELKEKKEEAARREDENRREAERIQAIKKKEMARISRERKREDERRRTQEIVFTFNPNSSTSNGTGNESTVKSSEQASTASSETSSITKSRSALPSFNTRRSFRQSVRKKEPIESSNVNNESWSKVEDAVQLDNLDFVESKPPASPPILLRRATVSQATDYVKRKHVIRLTLSDASEYLFAVDSEEDIKVWLDKMLAANSNSEGGDKSPKSLPPPPAEPPSSSTDDEPVYANAAVVVQEESSFDDEADTHSHKEKKNRFGRFFGRSSKAAITSGVPFHTDKELMINEERTHEEVSTLVDGVGVRAVKWLDNKCVNLLSTFSSALPLEECKRFDKKKREITMIPCPAIVKVYNKFMGGMDLMDSLIALKCMVALQKRFESNWTY
ncbi:SPTB [Lepeophtheirus salmonis]|uniref:SPTB n=1 Tax=Lepeophtheirus salmonis TaxID=72036 RepID=A0A7R8CF96_LEPSM|nr:SPTB [Lepeophtheirus salmonis]CAF2804241.1 SPTB [Lepeophtheirus salmonis]